VVARCAMATALRRCREMVDVGLTYVAASCGLAPGGALTNRA
jgi:hypothetical protein